MNVRHMSQVCAAIVALLVAGSTRADSFPEDGGQWNVGVGEAQGISAVMPKIAGYAIDGTVNVFAGGSVSVTGATTSVIGTTAGRHGSLAIDGGAWTNVTYFIAGNGTGATGSVSVAEGGSLDVLVGISHVGYYGGIGYLTVTGGTVNAVEIRLASEGYADRNPYAECLVSNATLRCTEKFRLSPSWPTTKTKLNTLASILRLEDGGTLVTPFIIKNDDPISEVVFAGGRMNVRDEYQLRGGGLLRIIAERAEDDILLDSAYNAVFNNAESTRAYFTGPGGFRKEGVGTLRLPTSDFTFDYQGNTTIQSGTLKLGASDQIPDGAGFGNLMLAGTSSVLDLNGFSDSVNTVAGAGYVTGTAASSLGVLTDGASDRWDFDRLYGAADLVKKGIGTLTLANGHLPGDLIVENGKVIVRNLPSFGTHCFWRFKVESTRAAENIMIIEEIKLLDGERDVTPLRSEVLYDRTRDDGKSAYESNQEVWKAVDGIVTDQSSNNRWADNRMKDGSDADKQRIWIGLRFAMPQRVTGYAWSSSNNLNRDPKDWRFQYSDDGTTWSDANVVTGFINTALYAWMPTCIPETVPATNSIFTAGVTVADGAELVLTNDTLIVTELNGEGKITFDGTTLDVNAGTFSGNLAGNGTLLKRGEGTLDLAMENPMTVGLDVQEGTAIVRNRLPYACYPYYRFKVEAIRTAGNVMIINELRLLCDGEDVTAPIAEILYDNTRESGTSPFEGGQEAWKALDGYTDGATTTSHRWADNRFRDGTDDDKTRVWVGVRFDAPRRITHYSWHATGNTGRHPKDWRFQASNDGVVWVDLHTVTNFIYNQTETWTEDFILTSYGTNAMFAANAPVSVASGASLVLTNGTESITTLTVDMTAGAGTINVIDPVKNGTIHLVNVTSSLLGQTLPLTFGTIRNAANFKTWRVYVNGELKKGLAVKVDSLCHLVVYDAQGFIFSIF